MAEKPTSRREFLHGKSAAEALSGVGERWVEERPEGRRVTAATLTLTRRAMACDFQVRLNATAQQNESEAALAALDVVESIEDRLTVYRDESELIELNRAAADGPALVATDVFELLELADRLHRDSAGAFDITGGPLSKAWGFWRRAGRLPTDDAISEALEQVGWRHVELDPAEQTIEFLRPGIGVDFNSVGKGFALDRAADSLTGDDVNDFLLHGGRSTLVARGEAADGEHAGWGVGVRNPLRPAERIAECRLRNAAFSTSGSATQCFVLAGKRYGHLLDPRTGWPAEGLHSVSVVAPTGAEADALSTAFYVMGPAATLAYCRTRPEVQVLCVLPGEGGRGVSLQTANLDETCWRLTGKVSPARTGG